MNINSSVFPNVQPNYNKTLIELPTAPDNKSPMPSDYKHFANAVTHKLDQNNDGKLSRDEFQSVSQNFEKESDGAIPAAVAFDLFADQGLFSNADKISPNEIAQTLEKMNQREGLFKGPDNKITMQEIMDYRATRP